MTRLTHDPRMTAFPGVNPAVGACSRAAVGMTRWVLDVWERGVAKMEGPRDADDGEGDMRVEEMHLAQRCMVLCMHCHVCARVPALTK